MALKGTGTNVKAEDEKPRDFPAINVLYSDPAWLGVPVCVMAGWVGFEPTICGSAGRRLGPGSTTSP